MVTSVYEGGCHCGAVRFSVRVDKHEALACNCSICTKKGYLHLIVAKDRFTLLSGEDALETYSFGSGVAVHRFCRTCGIHPFYTPRSHPDCIDVNVHCLDGDARSRFCSVPFNGRDWDANVDSIR